MYCDRPPRGGGLGFLPGVALVGSAAQDAGVISGAWDVAGDLFGFGGPEWEEDALAGRIECPGPFNPRQVEAALAVVPRGTPGLVGPGGPSDPTLGTVEGARVALEVHPDFRSKFRPANNRELANALVYVAHGAEDCDPGDWKDEPAVVHVRALLARAAQLTGAPVAPVPGPTPGVWTPPLPVDMTPIPGTPPPPPLDTTEPTGRIQWDPLKLLVLGAGLVGAAALARGGG